MNKVKEEFLLALIFVGKWVALGFGIIGILYFAIYLAYHSSFYDPLIAGYDLEISELNSKLEKANNEINVVEEKNTEATNKLKQLQNTDLLKAEENIERTRLMVKYQGVECIIDSLNPFSKNQGDNNKACVDLNTAEHKKEEIINEIKLLENEIDSNNASITDIRETADKHTSEIEEVRYEKRKAEVDVKGPLFWLAGILGLT